MSALRFSVRLAGRWIGVARVGSDEYRTITGYGTRQEAAQAAREIAARLMASRRIAAPAAAEEVRP